MGYKIEPWSPYRENIFSSEDFYLYRAIINFYRGSYKASLADFEESMREKREQQEQFNNDDESQHSQRTDLSDVGLCSINTSEASFNMILCLILDKNWQQALKQIERFVKDAPARYSNQIWLLKYLIVSLVHQDVFPEKDLALAYKLDRKRT